MHEGLALLNSQWPVSPFLLVDVIITVDRVVFALMNEGKFARPALQGCFSSRCSDLQPGKEKRGIPAFGASLRSLLGGVSLSEAPPSHAHNVWCPQPVLRTFSANPALPLLFLIQHPSISQLFASMYYCLLFRKKCITP